MTTTIIEPGIVPLRLGNLDRLAQRLRTSVSRLSELAGEAESFYKPFALPAKRDWFSEKEVKKPRPIDRPTGELIALQTRINDELLRPVLMPAHIFGAVPKRTIYGNAECHRGCKLLITLDITQCFPSISPKHVYRVWTSVLGCSPDIAGLLTRLTTFERRLPQGAPTSPALANLLIWSIDSPVRVACGAADVQYSTWLDDLAFSGEKARELIQPTIACFAEEGLRFAHRKIHIMGSKEVKTLTGTRFGGQTLRVPGPYCSRVRAGIRNLAIGRVRDHETDRYVEQLLGRLRYIERVSPADALPLKAQIVSLVESFPTAHRPVLRDFASRS